MSANPTPTVPGTQAPTPIELAWERYKSIIYVVLLAAIGALVANYAIRKYNQGKTDQQWSSFATTLGLDEAYTDPTSRTQSLVDQIDTMDSAALTAAAASASDAQRPFLLMAIARKAVAGQDWAAAEAALAELETKYPHHSLVKATSHPVQVLEPVKPDPDAQTKPKKPEWKPAVAGSAVSRMRAQIEVAKSFAVPPQFAKHEIPPDVTKVKLELSGDYGSVTIGLMPQTPKHREAFLELARAQPPFWEGLAIDEIRRSNKRVDQPRELHLGLATSRGEDRTAWTSTEPSSKIVEFEASSLSHFAGAVSADPEKDGKSSAERFAIVLDDAPWYDGERVVFAYVLEGMENLERVVDAAMATTEQDEAGRGQPEITIRVTKVTVLE